MAALSNAHGGRRGAPRRVETSDRRIGWDALMGVLLASLGSEARRQRGATCCGVLKWRCGVEKRRWRSRLGVAAVPQSSRAYAGPRRKLLGIGRIVGGGHGCETPSISQSRAISMPRLTARPGAL